MSTPRKPSPEKPKVVNLEEVAAYLHVHRSTIYRLLRQGKLPGFRIGSDWRFNLEDLRLELLQFPYGRHDDQADSISQFLHWIGRRNRNPTIIRELR
jgi:excisionase family DNA binding protein